MGRKILQQSKRYEHRTAEPKKWLCVPKWTEESSGNSDAVERTRSRRKASTTTITTTTINATTTTTTTPAANTATTGKPSDLKRLDERLLGDLVEHRPLHRHLRLQHLLSTSTNTYIHTYTRTAMQTRRGSTINARKHAHTYTIYRKKKKHGGKCRFRLDEASEPVPTHTYVPTQKDKTR